MLTALERVRRTFSRRIKADKKQQKIKNNRGRKNERETHLIRFWGLSRATSEVCVARERDHQHRHWLIRLCLQRHADPASLMCPHVCPRSTTITKLSYCSFVVEISTSLSCANTKSALAVRRMSETKGASASTADSSTNKAKVWRDEYDTNMPTEECSTRAVTG